MYVSIMLYIIYSTVIRSYTCTCQMCQSHYTLYPIMLFLPMISPTKNQQPISMATSEFFVACDSDASRNLPDRVSL